MRSQTARYGFLFALTLFLASADGQTAPPRALPAGQRPDDIRLSPPKDLNGYFPFDPPTDPGLWSQRAEQVRRRILVSQGLWPMPTRTPLEPVLHGRIDLGDYSVEKVYFQSAPGFFVTGNLYRPKGRTGKVPGVLFAHGHWKDARLAISPPEEVRREIASGAERFEEGGRSRFQSMCVQLARMGCVVWQWDMLGDSDSRQISRELVHGFAKQRPEMNTVEDWGLFSPQAEAHLQGVMGLQTWNSIRSLDFLLDLPEVDPDRIAVTGASGGGTQTMILAAIDPRVRLSFPAVMVSTGMQGGCTCENACLLRVGTGNVEFAALAAPRPQGLTTADDWTREFAMKGFPQLRQTYQLVGAPEAVMLHRGEHFPHNYNAVARSAFHTWLNHHFRLGQPSPVIERDYRVLTPAELTVWNAEHPAPKPADPDFERRLLRMWQDDAQEQLASWMTPDDFRSKAGGAVEVLIGRTLQETGKVDWHLHEKVDRGDWLEMAGTLRNPARKEELPVVFLHPRNWSGTSVLCLTGQGKTPLFGEGGGLHPGVRRLVQEGATVIGADLLFQGEFLVEGQTLNQSPKVAETRESAAYTLGYNPSVFAERVHDVLTLVRFISANERRSSRIVLVGIGGAGPVVATARALCRDQVAKALVETGGFRFGKLLDFRDPDFLPGGAKYGDLPGMLALSAPARTWVVGESPTSLDLAVRQYAAAGAAAGLKVDAEAPDEEAIVRWILE